MARVLPEGGRVAPQRDRTSRGRRAVADRGVGELPGYRQAAGHHGTAARRSYPWPGLIDQGRGPRDLRGPVCCQISRQSPSVSPSSEVFVSNEVASTGIVPPPDPSQIIPNEGHEVLAIGYPQGHPEHCLCRNSWGTGWGMDGYFLMPWSVLLDPSFSKALVHQMQPRVDEVSTCQH